jgi:hypothetical protein
VTKNLGIAETNQGGWRLIGVFFSGSNKTRWFVSLMQTTEED